MKKYLPDITLLSAILLSLICFLLIETKAIGLYYIIILGVFIVLKVRGFNLIEIVQCTPKTVLIFITVSSFSILSLFLLETLILNKTWSIVKTIDQKILFTFLIFNPVRIFGEELIFRGFLLLKEIKTNNLLFWIFNILQSIIFATIHYFFMDTPDSRIIFFVIVFLLSIIFGVMNKKCSSLLPSFLIHWLNGLLDIFILFT